MKKTTLLLVLLISSLGFAQITDQIGNTAVDINGTNLTGNISIDADFLNLSGKILLNKGVIQRGGTPITNTLDLGLYSHLPGNWVRIVSNNAPIRFFTDIGNGGAGSDPKMSLEANGNIGIGTTSPGSLLDIRTKDNKGILINKNNQSAITFLPNNGNSIFHLGHGHDNKLHLSQGNNVGDYKLMTFANSGNLGIGTENPSEKLTVKGKILCGEVEVVLESTIPADYVFEKYYNGFSNLKADYVMPTLEEVEAFTKANHHLPEVPSAQELKEDGLQLKEMTNLLLQKLEELTLYTIEQEKRIKTLEAQIAK